MSERAKWYIIKHGDLVDQWLGTFSTKGAAIEAADRPGLIIAKGVAITAPKFELEGDILEHITVEVK